MYLYIVKTQQLWVAPLCARIHTHKRLDQINSISFPLVKIITIDRFAHFNNLLLSVLLYVRVSVSVYAVCASRVIHIQCTR